MANVSEVYKCMTCGNIVVVVHGGDGELVWRRADEKDGRKHRQMRPKKKHVPVIEKNRQGRLQG
jgi:superoxide reductase